MTEPKEPESKDEDDDEDDEDFVPLVVVAKIADVAHWIPEGLGKKFGSLACWFLLEDDAELVELFDRVPEGPMSKSQVATILGGLREFATERADELQAVLGPSDSIGLGFHADAPIAKVVASFEEDGFAVVGQIEDGHVVDDEDDEDEDGEAGES